MNNLKILDCTLRDGGYINDFAFGNTVIKDIISKLSKASIDIIECGFLREGATDENSTLFGSFEELAKVIGKKNPHSMYVAMLQYGVGELPVEDIPEYNGKSIDGIRITFHEHEIEPAFRVANQLMKKGYKVFIQPVGTTSYSDEALLGLIKRVNELHPYAFYMVDTLGTMYKSDLLRMFYLVDNNLNKTIALGFHSHNNLQMSFANAQELAYINTNRQLIVDSSVYGMGRGAGNLTTELITQYINANFGLTYDIVEILEIMDEYILPLNKKLSWGYNAAYFIASAAGCHPNYATFLINKHTLLTRDISAILNALSLEKRALYDERYINEQYLKYLSHHIDDNAVLEKLTETIQGRKVILLAPGKSLRESEKQILEAIKNKTSFVISVNFVPDGIPVNMVFASNLKRFSSLADLTKKVEPCVDIVVTSNISTDSSDNVSTVDYASYLNEEYVIADNAGLMCINLLKKIGITEITLAGFDGFTSELKENYYDENLLLDTESERLLEMNKATTQKIKQLKGQISINYMTGSVYDV